MQRLSKLIILLISVCFIQSVQRVVAQSLHFNQFGIEEGLPQSGVNALAADNIGRIWIGTMSGVTSYNGTRFQTYSKNNGLAENRVSALHVTSHDQLLVGHFAGGISTIDVKTKTIASLDFKILTISKAITSLVVDSASNLWIGTYGDGVYCYIPSESELKNYYYNGSGTLLKITQLDPRGNYINQLLLMDKMLYAATDRGMYRMGLNGKSVIDKRVILPELLIKKAIKCIAIYNDAIMLGTVDGGLFKLTKDLLKITKQYSKADGLSDNYIKNITITKNNTLFVGTNNGGLCKHLLNLEQNNFKGPVFQQITTNQGLSNDKINAITQDREDNIWIGTALNLNQYFDEQFEIYSNYEGLTNSIVWSVIQDKNDRNFWLGTEGGLVHFIRGNNTNHNTFEKINDNFTEKIKNTTALYQDRLGRIWYSNFGTGIYIYDPKTKKSVNLTIKNGLTSNEIYDITGDAEDNIWIATNKGGACKYNITTQKIESYTIDNGLGGNNVYTIYKDSKNRLWFGILGGNLTVLENGSFRKFNTASKYESFFTLCFTEDLKGNIWIGTYEKGLYKFDGRDFSKPVTSNDNLSDFIYLLETDDKNNLWIGTPTGISKLNLADKTAAVKHYGKHDGFLGVEINPNAVCKDIDGNIWLGSIIGLVKCNSINEKLNTVEPVIHLSKPRINFEEQLADADEEYKHTQNHLTFDFVGSSLTNPKRVRYKYFLEGMDKTWLPETKQNFVTYPNLPPGSYTFWLKAANNDGVWTKNAVSYSFVINPPIYKTKWFYALIAVLFAVAAWGFLNYREQRLQKANKSLEAQVQVRTEQLNVEKENVQKQNKEINTQKVELERKNINITDSIDYAKRIQDSIFVSINEIEVVLKNAFIFFLPKDIVSGDFYWMYKKNSKVFFAVADCTGHGVPGAFMSIIAYNLLNEVCNDLTNPTPATILDELKLRVNNALNRKRSEANIQDGLDIALCAIDFDTLTLEYAGAFNPMYIIRNNELIENKPDKISIGKTFYLSETNSFINQQMTLQKNDVLYLFTDGFVDQIGGDARRKYYLPSFKNLLLDIHAKPIKMQVALLADTLNKWKGGYEQIDDITIMGIKI